MSKPQKFILVESQKQNQNQLSLNINKSQQKQFCKSLHDQLNSRSKENSARSPNTQTHRMKKEGSLSHLIGNFFARKASTNKISIDKTVLEETSMNSKLFDDKLKQKVVQIKELKDLIMQKDQEILILSQNRSNSSCCKCERFQKIIEKLKEQLNSQHNQFMKSIFEMENSQVNKIDQQKNNTQILSGLLENKISQQKLIVQEVQSSINRLNQGFGDIDQNTHQLILSLQMDKQDLLQTIYNQKEEIQQLRQNETILQQKIQTMSQLQIKIFSENVQHKSNQNILKLDREIQVNFDQSLINQKSKLVSSIDKLSCQSDLLISQARSLY